MKSISLIQPWATLWALGIKECETRSWAAMHRGPLAVHASAGTLENSRKLFYSHELLVFRRLKLLPWNFDDLPFGAIIGQVNLIACEKMTLSSICEVPLLEQNLGIWLPGRVAWMAVNHRQYAEAIRCKGSQSVWEIPPGYERS